MTENQSLQTGFESTKQTASARNNTNADLSHDRLDSILTSHNRTLIALRLLLGWLLVLLAFFSRIPPKYQQIAFVVWPTVYLVLAIGFVVVTFQLARKMYDSSNALLVGLFAAVPVFGLLVMIILNHKVQIVLKRSNRKD